ncbi:MAG: YihY/virulence factor BrkB family protein [Thermoleophilaceae bacterium]|nr:YihY/virulence factor BrkB family protein [Thermoleophilaceae bacterium]
MKAFLVKAYSENLTGLSAMVAYNLLLSIFPLALLALFIAGRYLHSPELEQSVVEDLRSLFPSAAESTIVSALASIRSASTGLGLGALAASVWIGSSFWGALDTAFCQLYHVPCRSWVQQKRFALAMLVVVLVFFAATVAVPTIQSLLASGARDLPFGLSEVPGLLYLVSLGFGLVLLFLILCVIYWSVPNRFVPWRAVWPGATGATLAIAVIDYAFPFYLSNVSTIAGFGSAFTFILIVLLWFYVLAFIILAGATVNAMRFEAHEAAR